MRPEDVPADLLELAAGVSWEQGRWPGWPTWEEFSRRAAENLYDCKELRATHVRLTAEMLAAVVPEIQAQALEQEAAAYDRGVNERCAAELVADTRCDDCGLRYEERDQYGCQESGRGHTYDQEELDGRAEPLDATTFYGNELRRKAASLRATTPEGPTT